jgi:hypothetical protein
MLKKLIIGISAIAAIAASGTAATDPPVAKPALSVAATTQDTPPPTPEMKIALRQVVSPSK